MSNYEVYAAAKQPELLKKTCTLGDCIQTLQSYKETFSQEFIENQIDFVATLFEMDFGEIKRAVDDEKYWCL